MRRVFLLRAWMRPQCDAARRFCPAGQNRVSMRAYRRGRSFTKMVKWLPFLVNVPKAFNDNRLRRHFYGREPVRPLTLPDDLPQVLYFE